VKVKKLFGGTGLGVYKTIRKMIGRTMVKKSYNDDDGRQIADMSGIDSSLYSYSTVRKATRKKKDDDSSQKTDSVKREELTLTKKETRAMMFHAMWSSFLIGLVFVALAAVFLLFAVFVWFR